MPANANVIINYASYDACGVVDFRTSRLRGLQTMLETNGHSVTLNEIAKIRNIVELFVNGEKVYTCDINKLDYGGDGQLDPFCHEALEKVNEAF